jgi:hypothetical protein
LVALFPQYMLVVNLDLDLDPVPVDSPLPPRQVRTKPAARLDRFLLVLLSRISCHTGVNVSSVAMATPALHVLISSSSV